MRRILSVVCAVALFALEGAPLRAEDKPNIVFILADDLGWTDLACQGSKYYETPNIDRLASEGTRFTSCHSAGPNCQPTRAALMSGQYGARTGIYTVGSMERFDWRSRPLRPVDNVTEMPLDRVLLPASLKKAGYATAMFGKWHLGAGAYHPSKRGFDEAIESAGEHFNFKTDPPMEIPKGTYLADWLTDRAVDFIRRHKDGPFFLYLPHFGVHAPWVAKDAITARFKGKPGVGGHKDPVYAAMIASVDESVGRIVALLKELDLEKKTLVIFSSDNGGVGGYVEAGIAKEKAVTDNAPLRGGKGMLYEGGVRVPYIARWPGVVPAGAVSGTPIHSVDLYPTCLELTGAPVPAGQALDGTSLVRLIKSGGKEAPPERPLFWHFPGYLGAGPGVWRTLPGGGIRKGDWKLLEYFKDGRLELYNLADDIGQKNDLAAKDPERVKAMHAELVAWRKSVNAAMPKASTEGERAGGKGKRGKNKSK